ncbi:uncharacterized protein LOC116204020 [Punica granatum]|uniref:Uncharacterized protein LOC116204020 n=2 Tax=Punica granatum TaxID=22663 RepID=A0A6P8DBJ7_PUNGR|nr:uncharacterized protein LOC116204020 [Punica granatum]XP_031391899.1 uncharacterized protein LOC116204020 [Punica granatum]PKI54627.1 hypothetical protein CRG98_024978 [Punica granatum]
MEKKELGFPRSDKLSLREQAARTVLRNVRAQGHPYVDLREDKKRFIYFCTLCLAPCYNDGVLFDHLNGHLHNERLAAAKLTLLKPNPWPFNDGILFFDNSKEDDKLLGTKEDSPRLLEFPSSESLAIVEYGDETQQLSHQHDAADAGLDDCGESCNFLIPNVLIKAEMSDLMVRYVGVGKIAARFMEKDQASSSISRIWCEWLGKQSLDDDAVEVPKHDFAIIVLAYNYELGRRGLFDEVKSLLTSSLVADSENGDEANKKRKKCFSDPEDESVSLSHQYDSSGEESAASSVSSSKLLLDRCDDQVLHTRIISSKTIRRELRRQQRIAAERMCDICQQKMLPGKDVATLLNLKTGRLACSSRNSNGAFHVYHTSCLIHWILLCEFEIARSPPPAPQTKGRSRKKNGGKISKVKKDGDGEEGTVVSRFNSVFCPECQGTGISVDVDSRERDKVSLSQMFNFKLKVSDARKAWIKSPEALENCSIGFHFPENSEEKVQEKVLPLKLLNFYGAIDRGCPNGSLEPCK